MQGSFNLSQALCSCHLCARHYFTPDTCVHHFLTHFQSYLGRWPFLTYIYKGIFTFPASPFPMAVISGLLSPVCLPHANTGRERSAGGLSEFHCCILSPEKSVGRGTDPQSNKGIGKQKDQEEASLWHEQWDSIATTAEGWELSVDINSEKMCTAEGGRKTRDKVRQAVVDKARS